MKQIKEEVIEQEPTEEEKQRCDEIAKKHANEPVESPIEEEPVETMTDDEIKLQNKFCQDFYADMELEEDSWENQQNEGWNWEHQQDFEDESEEEEPSTDPETQHDLKQQNAEHEAEQGTEENTATTEETHTEEVEPPPEEEEPEQEKPLDLTEEEDRQKYVSDIPFTKLFELVISKQQTEDTNFEGLTDADPDFIHTCALFVLSTVAKRFKVQLEASLSLEGITVEDYMNDKVSGLGLNLPVVGFGKSRKARKTTMMNYNKQMITGMMKYTKTQPHIMGDSFSPEAFISQGAGTGLISKEESDSLRQKQTEEYKKLKDNNFKLTKEKFESVIINDICSWLLWIQDEVLKVFVDMKDQRSNMRNFGSTLAQLLDGNSYQRMTKSSGVEIIPKPFFTMFVTSTETLPQAFDKKDFGQGWMNRPLFIAIKKGAGATYIEEEDEKDEANENSEDSKKKYQQKTRRLTDLENTAITRMHKWLASIANIPHNVPVTIKDDAYELMQSYIDSKFKGIDEDSLIGTYLGNAQNLLIKSSGLYMLDGINENSTWNFEFFQRQPAKYSDVCVLHIEKCHMEKAIDFFERVAMDGIQKVVHEMAKANMVEDKIIDVSKTHELIASTLKGQVFEGHYVTLKDAMIKNKLQKAVHMDAYILGNHLKTMTENGDIEVTKEQSKFGAPADVIRLLSEEEKEQKPIEATEASDIDFTKFSNQPQTKEEVVATLCEREGGE